jgi:hypothetical protein
MTSTLPLPAIPPMNPPQSPSSNAIPMRRSRGVIALAALLLLAQATSLPAPAADGPPPLLSFQTLVLDSVGNPLSDGALPAKFRICNAESGGGAAAVLWEETQTVSVMKGYVSVILGQGSRVKGGELATHFGVAGDAERYIEVEIDGSVIAPRLRMLPTAYSFVSAVAMKVVNAGVDSAMLKDGAVGNAALASQAVTSAKIADGTIVSADLASSAVGEANLAVDAVTTLKIKNGNVTSAKIADGTIVSADLASSAVGEANLASDAVTTAKIKNNHVSREKLGANSVDSARIVDGSVAAADLADGAVIEGKLGAGAVTGAKIAGLTVGTANLANGAVSVAKLADSLFQTQFILKAGLDETTTWQITPVRSVTEWYPLLSGYHMGYGDLNETGAGELGGIWFFVGADQTWHCKAGMRTHSDKSDVYIRVLWIAKRLVQGDP